MQEAFATATKLAGNIKKLDGVSDALIPQDLGNNYLLTVQFP
jgi:hypothetical protein